MKAGYCATCGVPFVGGNRRVYCSLRCKRRLEGKRRAWGHLNKVVKHLRFAANREDLSAARREEYQARADALAAKIGGRP